MKIFPLSISNEQSGDIRIYEGYAEDSFLALNTGESEFLFQGKFRARIPEKLQKRHIFYVQVDSGNLQLRKKDSLKYVIYTPKWQVVTQGDATLVFLEKAPGVFEVRVDEGEARLIHGNDTRTIRESDLVQLN